MLSPYRSIGQFSTHVGHQIRYHSAQKVPIVVCPIGNVFISYYVDRPEIGHLGGMHLVQCHLHLDFPKQCTMHQCIEVQYCTVIMKNALKLIPIFFIFDPTQTYFREISDRKEIICTQNLKYYEIVRTKNELQSKF